MVENSFLITEPPPAPEVRRPSSAPLDRNVAAEAKAEQEERWASVDEWQAAVQAELQPLAFTYGRIIKWHGG